MQCRSRDSVQLLLAPINAGAGCFLTAPSAFLFAIGRSPASRALQVAAFSARRVPRGCRAMSWRGLTTRPSRVLSVHDYHRGTAWAHL